jgi:hypothetical protein
MQSFIVTLKAQNPTLEFTLSSTQTSVAQEDTLRSGSVRENLRMLEIFAERGTQISKALLLYKEEASPDYRSNEDSYKLFPSDTTTQIMVYMRSSDGYALDINTIGNFSGQVALGVRTSETGAITLRFAGMENFGAAQIRLHDTKANRVINLSEQSEYTFTKYDTEGLYLEDRFYLSFNGWTVLDTPDYSGISVTGNRLEIHILSNDGRPLGSVRVFDLQGRCLLSTEAETSSYFYRPNQPGVYIVKVENPKVSEMKKVLIP